ncbi:MAG: tetratricopeptide repeat protein [Gammaproteobacteria bacterium]|nr:MAG: tetratricopeptide repeat protein [Gammaproteobacteria bacterium]
MRMHYSDIYSTIRYSLIDPATQHSILKINVTIPRILYLSGAILLAFGLASCSSIPGSTGGARSSENSIQIRKPQSERYDAQSELMYEVLVGELSGQFGDVDQALEHYVNASLLTDEPSVAERATRIAMFAKDWPAGIKAASRWSELVGENLEISQILGVLELRSGNVDGAVPHFEKIMLAADDSPAKGYSIIGAVLAREPDSESSLKLLEKLVNKHFENPYGHLTLASLAFQSQDFQRTIDESELALGFKPDLIEARAMRAQALMNLDEVDQALAEMKIIVEEEPGNREMRTAYSRMLIGAERYDEAIQEFEVLLVANPNDGELVYRLGLLYLQQEKYAKAKVKFKRLVDRKQRVDESHYYIGRTDEELKNYSEAIAEFENVKQGEYYIDAKARIASIHAERDGLDKAQSYLKDLRDTLSAPESIIEVYLIEGQLLHDEELYVAAMDLYSEGLQEFPGHSDLLYARALMAEEIDRIDLLEADLKTILSEDPENASALNALGYTLADHNTRVDEALGYIKKALEIRPDDPAVMDSMGWVHFRLGNYAEAETYLRKAFGILEDAEIAGHLVELLWAQGNYDEANKVMSDMLKRYPEDEYILELKQRLQ